MFTSQNSSNLTFLLQEEWNRSICATFKQITETRDCESLQLTVEAVKSEKAHYGFKSRLNVSVIIDVLLLLHTILRYICYR